MRCRIVNSRVFIWEELLPKYEKLGWIQKEPTVLGYAKLKLEEVPIHSYGHWYIEIFYKRSNQDNG